MKPIVLENVSKFFSTGIFKRKLVLDGLTLEVNEGEILGLLGPNGSGKSTTLKIIMGFLKPSSGRVTVCGIPSTNRMARQHVGYLPEVPKFQRFLSAAQTLFYYGRVGGMNEKLLRSRVFEMLELVGLAQVPQERVLGFSKGMVQRLAIAQSLLHFPSLLILDEPMSGLDPIGRRDIRLLILKIKSAFPKTTVFFSTHILSDVEEICSSVALLKQGRLITHTPIAHILGSEMEYEISLGRVQHSTMDLSAFEKQETPSGLKLKVPTLSSFNEVLHQLIQEKVPIIGLHCRHASLEDRLFGKESRLEERPSK